MSMRKLQKSYKSNTRIYDDGSIVVTTTPDGESLTNDWLSDFSWSEIRDIYHIVKENITSQKFNPKTKRWE